MTQRTNIATRALDFKLKEFLNKSETEQQAAELGYQVGATDQQAIFDNLPKIKAWIAMDWDGKIILHFEKPIKWNSIWMSRKALLIDKDKLPEGCNPKWEDKEPIEVELTINLKKG